MIRLLRRRVGVPVFALIVLTLLGALMAVNQERVGAERDLALTVALTMRIVQMRTALFDYLLDPQPQSRRQAQDELAGLAGLLEREAGGIAAAIRHDRETRYAWESVRRLTGELQAFFGELEVDGARPDPRLAERHRRTVDLILVDSHALFLFVSQLRQRAGARAVQAIGRQNLALGVLLAGAGGLVLAFFRVVAQRARLEVEIAERRRLEAALRERETRWRQLAESMPNLVWTCDPAGHWDYLSRQWVEYTGVPEAQQLGVGWLAQVHPEDRDAVVSTWQRTVSGGEPFEIQFRLRRRDGAWRWHQTHAVPIRDAAGALVKWYGANTDVEALKRSEERIAQLAYYDALTGLANRRLFQERLAGAMAETKRYGQPLAALAADLNGFKAINDAFGHAAGDALLIEVAHRMVACVRACDTVARPGGDEFLLLFPQTGEDGAARLAERLVAAIATPFRVDGHELAVGCSLGIALYPDHALEASELLERADTAMYRAKQEGGRDYRFFTTAMRTETVRALALEQRLREGLARDELRLHYQPQLDLASGRAIGFEALVRWAHPERGLLGAGAFVPLAETSGLIDALMDWVLCAALGQVQAWVRAGLPALPVAVNLSARALRNARQRTAFCTRTQQVLCDAGVAPGLLELELELEYGPPDGGEEVLAALQVLRELGVRLAIDRFGSGCSSLHALKRWPVDRLKIDRSLVRKVATHREDAGIVDTVLALGRHLKFPVLAQGVETAAQLEKLRALGCAQAQGYYFSRPLPAREAQAWLARAA